MSNLWSRGVVVITSALHAEGPQFDPGRDQFCLVLGWKILGERNLESNSTCQVGRVVSGARLKDYLALRYRAVMRILVL